MHLTHLKGQFWGSFSDELVHTLKHITFFFMQNSAEMQPGLNILSSSLAPWTVFPVLLPWPRESFSPPVTFLLLEVHDPPLLASCPCIPLLVSVGPPFTSASIGEEEASTAATAKRRTRAMKQESFMADPLLLLCVHGEHVRFYNMVKLKAGVVNMAWANRSEETNEACSCAWSS